MTLARSIGSGSVPPSSWLDTFYSDQKLWVSTAFAGMFALQISLMLILTAGKGSIFRLSILLALAGAATFHLSATSEALAS